MAEVYHIAGGLEGRLLTTMDFLREVAKIGGIRHEVSAIYKRWVSGRGCPKIMGAYFYNRWASSADDCGLCIHLPSPLPRVRDSAGKALLRHEADAWAACFGIMRSSLLP